MPNPITKELGSTGTHIYKGYISDHDYNPSLTGWSRIKIYDEMRKGDATVRASLLAVFLPIVSTDWYIKPASEDKKDIEIADHIKKELIENRVSWSTKLREILLYLVYGSYVFEKVYTRRSNGLIGIEKLAPRLPKTILKWEMDDGNQGITQMTPTGTYANIPAWKILTFVNEQEGENYEGISLLRTAYKHWYYKERYYKIDAMAQERQGLGVPYFKKPNGATPKDVELMRELMRNFRANEEAYMEIPLGWEAGIMEMKASQVKDAEPMIGHHDRQITKNVLAQFLELGATGGSGSRALSEDHSDLFLLSENAVAKYVRETVQRDLIKELVDFNYSVDKYPELTYGNIGMIDYEKLTKAIASLSSSKMITSNYETEQHLRKTMKLPEIDKEEYDNIHAQIREDMLSNKVIDSKNKNKPDNNKIEDDLENNNSSQQGNKLHASETILQDVLQFSEQLKNAIAKKSAST